MQPKTTSAFSNDNFLYITDDDGGIKDMVFGEILGFQPTLGTLFAHKKGVELFVDDRYFSGVYERLHNTLSKHPQAPGTIHVYKVVSRTQKLEEILQTLKHTLNIHTLNILPNLALKQIQELVQTAKKLNIVICIVSQTPKHIQTQALTLIEQMNSTPQKKAVKNLYITHRASGLRDDHFLYYLGVDPAFGILIQDQKSIIALVDTPEKIRTGTKSLCARFHMKTGDVHIAKCHDVHTLCKTAFSHISPSHIQLSALMTLGQLYDILIAGQEHTFCIQRPEFEPQRSIKTREELQEHKHAIQTIESVYKELLTLNTQGKLKGKKEKELVAYIQKSIKKNGGLFESFPSIVSVGKNSAVPHHIPTQTVEGNDKVQDGVVLFDIGAVSTGGRCSDFTRVLFVGEKKGQLFQDFCLVQQLVYDIHMFAAKKAKVSMSVGELDHMTREFALKKAQQKEQDWRELFSRLSFDLKQGFEVCMKQVLYSHGLGHGVGIRIHEFPYFSKHASTKLQQGMCITIEPGVYIPGYFGVRLENLYYVGKTGTLKTYNTVPLRFR